MLHKFYIRCNTSHPWNSFSWDYIMESKGSGVGGPGVSSQFYHYGYITFVKFLISFNFCFLAVIQGHWCWCFPQQCCYKDSIKSANGIHKSDTIFTSNVVLRPESSTLAPPQSSRHFPSTYALLWYVDSDAQNWQEASLQPPCLRAETELTMLILTF